jgi:replicative DNA helicase
MEKPTVQSLQLIKRAAMQIKDLPLMLVKPANRRLSTVLAAIRRCHRECGARVLAVDYLQLINAESDSREGEISEASHSLQQIAGELGVTLLILTQLNQDGDTKHGRVIEEDADAVIQIVQDRNKESQTYKQHRFILLQKDRHYGNGGRRIPLVLDRDTIRFKHGMDETDAGSKTKPKYQR